MTQPSTSLLFLASLITAGLSQLQVSIQFLTWSSILNKRFLLFIINNLFLFFGPRRNTVADCNSTRVGVIVVVDEVYFIDNRITRDLFELSSWIFSWWLHSCTRIREPNSSMQTGLVSQLAKRFPIGLTQFLSDSVQTLNKGDLQPST